MKKVIVVLLGVISLVYIGVILTSNFNSIDNISAYFSVKNIIFALVPGVLMLASKSYLNTLIIEDIEDIKIDKKLRIISVYSNAQVIRYLPGKIWGIVYQSEQLSKMFARKTTWFSNLIQMAITNINSFVVLGTMYLYISMNSLLALGYLITSIAVLFITLKTNTVYHIVNKFVSEKYKLLPKKQLTPLRSLAEIMFLQLDWLLYFFAWYLLAPSHSLGESFILIGATYAAASLLGMLAFVMPSGWLVREASFLWLGALVGLSQNILLIYSVIARMFFILADLLWAALLSILLKVKGISA